MNDNQQVRPTNFNDILPKQVLKKILPEGWRFFLDVLMQVTEKFIFVLVVVGQQYHSDTKQKLYFPKCQTNTLSDKISAITDIDCGLILLILVMLTTLICFG